MPEQKAPHQFCVIVIIQMGRFQRLCQPNHPILRRRRFGFSFQVDGYAGGSKSGAGGKWRHRRRRGDGHENVGTDF